MNATGTLYLVISLLAWSIVFKFNWVDGLASFYVWWDFFTNLTAVWFCIAVIAPSLIQMWMHIENRRGNFWGNRLLVFTFVILTVPFDILAPALGLANTNGFSIGTAQTLAGSGFMPLSIGNALGYLAFELVCSVVVQAIAQEASLRFWDNFSTIKPVSAPRTVRT